MPDAFTGLLVFTLALLAGVPERLGWRTRWTLAAGAAAMITLHLSHLVLAASVVAGVLLWRRATERDSSERAWPGRALLAAALLPPLLAVGLLAGVNLAGHGRATLAPFGSVFLLARLLEDGPARVTLDHECEGAGWALCRDRAALPSTADAVLWSPDSPLQRLVRTSNDPRGLAREAAAIVGRTWRTQPGAVAAGAVRATLRQLGQFGTGDGLHAWPEAVTPQLARVLPAAELARYAAARQTRDALSVPAPLAELHAALACVGLLGCALLLAARQAAPAVRALALATLIAMPVNAAVTGALSGPHDRYQSRVMWLPLAVLGVAWPVRLRQRRPAVEACA